MVNPYENIAPIERCLLPLAQQGEYSDNTLNTLYHLAKMAPRPYLACTFPKKGTEVAAFCMASQGGDGKVISVVDPHEDLADYDANTEVFHHLGYLETKDFDSNQDRLSERINVPLGLLFFGFWKDGQPKEFQLDRQLVTFSKFVWKESGGILCGVNYESDPDVRFVVQETFPHNHTVLRGDVWVATFRH